MIWIWILNTSLLILFIYLFIRKGFRVGLVNGKQIEIGHFLFPQINLLQNNAKKNNVATIYNLTTHLYLKRVLGQLNNYPQMKCLGPQDRSHVVCL